MTKKQAAALKPGDRIVTKDGEEWTVIRCYGGWHGFLTSKEISEKKEYDFYEIVVRESPYLAYNHKVVQLAK